MTSIKNEKDFKHIFENEAKFKEDLRDLVNRMSQSKELRCCPLACYAEAIELAKKRFVGSTFDMFYQRIHNAIQT